MNTKTFETYESDVRSYCRHFPKVFTDAKGAVLKDEDGTEYIDFFCGAGAVTYGHNNPYIKQKVGWIKQRFPHFGDKHAEKIASRWEVKRKEIQEKVKDKINRKK